MSDLAVNTLADRSPPAGIGDNSGAVPLAEILAEEIAADEARADELIAAAETSRIADAADAAKVATLIRLLDAHEKTVDAARDARMRPFLASVRTVNSVYNPVVERMALCRAGPLLPGSSTKRRGGLLLMLDTYEKQREAAAKAERERIEAAQRRQQEEADRARQAAEAAKVNLANSVSAGLPATPGSSVAAELAAIGAQEKADALARQAQVIRPTPIRTAVGNVVARREIVFEITDLRKALGWLVKNRNSDISQAARTIIGRHLQSLGVDAIERGVEIAGVVAGVEKRAQVK